MYICVVLCIVGFVSFSVLFVCIYVLNKVKWIKGKRISWLGHLERMEEDRMP
jgi:hypothetical protein